MNKILVTRGAGFIGSHLVDVLVERGHEVVIYDNFEPQVHKTEPEYLNRNVELIRACIKSRNTWT
jgi:nucleoside-diphosphate-sugar epimerase